MQLERKCNYRIVFTKTARFCGAKNRVKDLSKNVSFVVFEQNTVWCCFVCLWNLLVLLLFHLIHSYLTRLKSAWFSALKTLDRDRVTSLLSRRFIKTHWTNTQNTNKKMTIHWFHSIAIQHKYQNRNTALSSSSVNAGHTSASLRWTVMTNASHAVHLLQQRCLVSGSFFF